MYDEKELIRKILDINQIASSQYDQDKNEEKLKKISSICSDAVASYLIKLEVKKSQERFNFLMGALGIFLFFIIIALALREAGDILKIDIFRLIP